MSLPSLTAVLERVPAPVVFIASGLTQYAGAGVAVGLFATLGAGEVGWWRIAFAALVLLLWRRPWRRTWTRHDLGWSVAFGAVLTAMNLTFYLAIEHLPLGTAVAIEFCGPVVVAALTGRGLRSRAAIAAAAAGVVLLAGVTLDSGLSPSDAAIGLGAIAAAATCWGLYILFGRRVARVGAGVDGLAVGMAAGSLLSAPFLAHDAPRVLSDGALVLLLVVVAVCSSVIPYGMEQVVLRRVPPATFAVLLALLPATAAVVGAVMLGQFPGAAQIVGLLCVSAAIVLAPPRD
ncbi:EamA family transporter [Myceligenerans crystallogenes]|uniref:EamA family transporter n=1 Tax=Myceligenerans crystallogenes TaxID=316335 RepID=A0ABN2NC93_9MICO